MNRNLNPNQLRMFMSAQEIRDNYPPNPVDLESEGRGDANVMDANKMARASEDQPYDERVQSQGTLAENIAAHGVKDPVHIMHGQLDRSFVRNGNHRVAVSMHTDPDRLIPVWHSDPHNYQAPQFDKTLPGAWYS